MKTQTTKAEVKHKLQTTKTPNINGTCVRSDYELPALACAPFAAKAARASR